MPRTNSHHFVNDIIMFIFFNAHLHTLIQISLKAVSKRPIYNNRPYESIEIMFCEIGHQQTHCWYYFGNENNSEPVFFLSEDIQKNGLRHLLGYRDPSSAVGVITVTPKKLVFICIEGSDSAYHWYTVGTFSVLTPVFARSIFASLIPWVCWTSLSHMLKYRISAIRQQPIK